MVTAQRLRILMVTDRPWDRRLGAARLQLELGEELRRRGHVVDKYSYTDAFPNDSKLDFLVRSFPRRARRHVLSVEGRYDVIDALEGSLPYSKEVLKFDGLFVARSCGLASFYRLFEQHARLRWPEEFRGTIVGDLLRKLKTQRYASEAERTFRSADLINVLNQDELAHLRAANGLSQTTVLIPIGLSPTSLRLLGSAATDAATRLQEQRVSFIGYWSVRKGSRDWSKIVRHVSDSRPATNFDFLGTGRPAEAVHQDLGMEPSRQIEVVPRFAPADLPGLLARATVGALPTYIEGCPLGVLEQLAAGIPTVAYDVPGPRETIGKVDRSLLSPAGDTLAFAARINRVLDMTEHEYSELAERCRAVAQQFSWRDLAAETERVYTEMLIRIRRA